jgi:hypothetical protein
MSIALGPLVVEAADPAVARSFWAGALGSASQRDLLSFRQEQRPKTVKNRVHLDLYVRDLAPLLDLGATVLGEYPNWVTLADVEDNEFCAFRDPEPADGPPARAFAVCTDSDSPESLAAWWAAVVGADVRDGPDGTPRWLYGASGWEGLIWKFVRNDDERVVPNRWQWSLLADPGVRSDPQGNQFSVRPAG